MHRYICIHTYQLYLPVTIENNNKINHQTISIFLPKYTYHIFKKYYLPVYTYLQMGHYLGRVKCNTCFGVELLVKAHRVIQSSEFNTYMDYRRRTKYQQLHFPTKIKIKRFAFFCKISFFKFFDNYIIFTTLNMTVITSVYTYIILLLNK